MRRVKADDIVRPHSFRITLSCGHVQYRIPPVPLLSSVIECGACRNAATVVVRDMRELAVSCVKCGVVSRHHMLATISADVAALKHQQGRGTHATTVVESGGVESV